MMVFPLSKTIIIPTPFMMQAPPEVQWKQTAIIAYFVQLKSLTDGMTKI